MALQTPGQIKMAQNAAKQWGIKLPDKITSGDISGATTPPPTVTPPVPATDAAGVMGAIESSQDQFSKMLEQQRKDAETAKKQSQQDYVTRLFETPTTSEVKADQYRDQGVDAAQKELDDINSQLQVEQHALRREIERIQDNAVGASMGQVTNMVNEAEGKSLRKQADLAVVQMGLQGKFNTAKAIADRAVDASMEKEKNIIEALKLNYEDNKEMFTKAEQREFDSLLNDRNNQYQQALADKKAISDYSLEAMKMGADGATVSAIRNATTPAEAQALAAQYISPLVQQDRALEQQYRQAQIDNVYSEIYKRNIDASAANQPEIDPANAIAYAQQYAATGKIPTGLPKGTFGIISQVAKDLPKQKGELIDARTGVAPDMDATSAQAYSALYSAIELSKQLADLDKQRIGGIIPGALGKITGSEIQQKYVDLRGQVIDLLSRARSGAALTVEEERRYAGMLPGRFSEPFFLGAQSSDRINNFTTALTSDLQNKASARGLSVNGLSTVDIGGTTYTVGDIITNESGQNARINADGTLTPLQ